MSESDKPDIVERLREYARWAEYLRLRNTLNDAIAEIERLRALPSRDDVLDVVEAECKRWDRNMGGDAGRSVWHYIVTATRALKKDQNNG